MPKVAISKTRARLLAHRAERSIELARAVPDVPAHIQAARDHFPVFCQRMGKEPMPHMRAWFDAFLTGESNEDLLEIAGPPTAILSPRGPLPLSTAILTPEGERELGTIEVGDRVYDEQGCPARVEGVVHLGPHDLYEVEHDDGTVLECDIHHDLKVRNERRRGSPWRRRTVQELLDRQRKWKKIRFASPIPDPIQRDEADLPLHPYLMGTLLMRSSSSNGSLRVTAREDTIKRLELYLGMLPRGAVFKPIVSTVPAWSLGPEQEGGSHPVRGWMKSLGLWGVAAGERFIPRRYLEGSIAQRLELLQGLCDQRGRLAPGGRVTLSAASPALIEDAIRLVRSLGGKPFRRSGRTPTIEFMLPSRLNPFGVRSLAEPYRHTWDAGQARRWLVRRIRVIRPTGRRAAVGCISVDSEFGTFVTADHLVSCNSAKSTIMGLLLAWVIGKHALARKLLRILYVSYSLPVARGKSSAIRATICSKAYQEIFPSVALSKDMTSAELWSIDFEKAEIDILGEDAFTVAATGALGSITSKRANLIVPDDLIKSRRAIKKLETREEMVKNWHEVIEPLMFEGSRPFALGTRFHQNDVFGTTFNEENGWKVLRQQALLYDEEGAPRSYWPERYSLEWLLAKKRKNENNFSYQYQNEAVASSESGMSEALIIKGDVPDQYDELAVGIDLSSGMSERNDYTVMTLAGLADGIVYLIDYRRIRLMGNLEKLDLLCELLWEWNILGKAGDDFVPTGSDCTVVPEEVAYQNSFRGDFESVLLGARGLDNLRARGIKGGGDKMTHLRAAVGLMQRRKLIFNRFRRWDAYTNEILNFGYTDHDDCADSMTLITRHWRRLLRDEDW